MPRRVLSFISFVALAALAGCQDYNFNPVGKCVIQPGAKRSEVAKIGTADVLFVVDDSGSMKPEQARLAANFSAFIDALAEVQKERAVNNLDPFEFHIAVTTTSVFESWKTSVQITCQGNPQQCAVPLGSTYYQTQADNVACSHAGETCDDLIRYYAFPSGPLRLCSSSVTTECCYQGVAQSFAPYPAGDFVALGGNERVLHFTKNLDWASWPNSPQLNALVQQFQENINVGSCGSGMEQPFEAARLALKKALHQDGLEQPVPQTDFMHDNSKLVVVFVGDEDDCSNENDPTRALAFNPDGTNTTPGSDVCISEQSKALDQQKLNRVADYADFLTSLGRPVSAAFVYSAKLDSCQKDDKGNVVCSPGSCACQCPTHCLTSGSGCGPTQSGDCWAPSPTDSYQCEGWDPQAESRYHELAAALRGQVLSDGSTVNTFEASVCQADWADTLRGIAKLVAPPAGLKLDTLPADKDVVALSIQDADGNPRSYCDGPDSSKDWWFVTDCADPTTVSTTATQCIALSPNPSAKCQPNPGETYIAFYLGRVPDSGCFSDDECNTAFHNSTASFTCQGSSGTRDTGGTPGTCICKAQ